MATSVFAPKYANAFAQVVTWHNLDVAAAQAQMKDFAQVLADSRELREILADPSVPQPQKLSVLDALAERLGIMREVRNFLAIIMDHERLGSLTEIINAYDQVADTRGGIADAEVTTARDLNDDDRQSLEAEVAKLAGSRVRVSYSQDAALIGGAVIRIGSTIYDGSVRAQLEQLKHSLVTA